MSFVKKFNTPVIVIGCHRSGTSLLTSMLKANGFFMGNDTYAHDESYFFQQINESILKQLGASWFNPQPAIDKLKDPNSECFRDLRDQVINQIESIGFKKKYLGLKRSFFWPIGRKRIFWGWKDPRNTITLPLWKSIFPDAYVVHIYRHGFDVANSLYRREKVRNQSDQLYANRCTSLEGSFNLWKEYEYNSIKLLDSIPNSNKISVGYENVLLHYEEYMTKIFDIFGIELKIEVPPTEIAKSRAYQFKSNHELIQDMREYCDDPLLIKLGYKMNC